MLGISASTVLIGRFIAHYLFEQFFNNNDPVLSYRDCCEKCFERVEEAHPGHSYVRVRQPGDVVWAANKAGAGSQSHSGMVSGKAVRHPGIRKQITIMSMSIFYLNLFAQIAMVVTNRFVAFVISALILPAQISTYVQSARPIRFLTP